MSETGVLVAGAHGHGRWHLANIRRLAEPLGLRLVGVCDPQPLSVELRELTGAVPVSGALQSLLDSTKPDVTIICTPIHTHVDLALTAMRAGSHVLLEKPPASSMGDYQRLVEGCRTSGRVCQIGFQSLGSGAIPAIRDHVASGAIGTVRGIGAAGVWVRTASYYARAAWAGRRYIDGVPVTDGALTNAFAHATATALSLDASDGPDEVTAIETDLYRANPNEADDTSSIRITTRHGTTITVAVTLCGAEDRDPYIRVHGDKGRITLWYKRDEMRLETADIVETATYRCTDLLANLVEHLRDPSIELLVPPERVGAFMRVVDSIRTGPEPEPIPERCQQVDGTGPAERRVVTGVEEAIQTAADKLALFRELDLPWGTESPTSFVH